MKDEPVVGGCVTTSFFASSMLIFFPKTPGPTLSPRHHVSNPPPPGAQSNRRSGAEIPTEFLAANRNTDEMDVKPSECLVCLDKYNESKRPRVLPCGHLFCSSCIETVQEAWLVTCPCCRTAHPASGMDDFPIVFAVEDLLRETDARGTDAMLPRRRGSRKLEELKEGQALAVQESAYKCGDLLSQMVEFKGRLLSWMTEHEALMKRLNDVIIHHKTAHQMLEREIDLLDEFYSEGRQKQRKLMALGETLHAAETPQEAATSIQDADEHQDEAESWLRKCLKHFPEANTVRRSIKIRAITEKALDVIDNEADYATLCDEILDNADSSHETADASGETADASGEAAGASGEAEDASGETSDTPGEAAGGADNGQEFTNLLDKFAMLKIQFHTEVTIGDLFERSPRAMELLQDWRIFAIQKHQGRLRSARITEEGGKVLLHRLRNNRHPLNSSALMHKDVMAFLDPATIVAFLELQWHEGCPYRVHFRLNLRMVAGKQFALLCTGEKGPCYANSTLMLNAAKGDEGESAGRGVCDSSRGSPHRLSFWGKNTWHLWKTVVQDSWVMLVAMDGVQLGIAHKGYLSNQRFKAFGEVESGLETLMSVNDLPDDTTVTITDCGVVIPM
ncbi:uncharacterized protein LOC134788022 [Penaeus indicus]|uniref:uncharacterized protein LOC134788022 n=1 Tax=Penaeus indicus TaxID=29960 RepID=UPI00300D27FF